MSDSQRQKILSCACDLYLKDGLEGFSMRKLAKDVGVTAPALYRHFRSREGVLVAMMGEAHRLQAQYLYRALQGHTPAERLERAAREYLSFASEHPEMYEMLYVSPHHLGLSELPLEVAEVAAATGRFWQDRVREAMEAGILCKGDPDAVGLTLWAHAHGFVTIHLRGICPVLGGEDLVSRFVESSRRLLAGLGGPSWRAHADAEAEAPVVGERNGKGARRAS
ncbi:MAG: TetR/AcrR family transcriptional regulator [Gemmatimonadota bacterium]